MQGGTASGQSSRLLTTSPDHLPPFPAALPAACKNDIVFTIFFFFPYLVFSPFSLLNPSETDEQRGDNLDDRGDERRGLSRFPSEVRRGGDRRIERGGERLSRFPHLSVQPKSQFG